MIAHSRRPSQERNVTYEVPSGVQIIALKPWQSALTCRKPHSFKTTRPQRFTGDDVIERRKLAYVFRLSNHPDGYDRILVPADAVIIRPFEGDQPQ